MPITVKMSIETTIARVDAIRTALADPAELVGASGGTEAPTATSASTSAPFATALAQAQAQGASAGQIGYAQPGALGGASGTALEPGAALYSSQGLARTGLGGNAGARIVAAAESQLGQAEQPPGSNEGPAIAAYRESTAGAVPGAPWCAYFASWAARQAGEPLGANGEGLGSVSEIWSWAQSTGRAIANGPGVVPKPGDLIVFGGEHVGIVREVLPGGQIATLEGNYENKVAANVRSAGEATGYVSMS
jgi:CHAP domain